MLPSLFEGTYQLKYHPGGYGGDGSWYCTVTFDGLEVSAWAYSRRRAFRKAHRAMAKAVKLRSAIRSVKGLCDEPE